MEKFIEKCKQWLFRKSVLYWSIAILLLAFLGIYLLLHWHNIYLWLGLDHSHSEQIEYAGAGSIFQNRTAIIGAITTTFIISSLTIWARILTHKQIKQTQDQIQLSREANASERYENAVRMLGDKILAVRIGGCQALRNLGLRNKDMALQCTQLLLHFISNPYLNEKELVSTEELTDDEKFEKIFPPHMPLRTDIQASVAGFSDICEQYSKRNDALDLGLVDLPSYFWKNRRKGKISLPNIRIVHGRMKEAHLSDANLQNALIGFTYLRGAYLPHANLKTADLTRTDLKDATLTMTNLQNTRLWGVIFQDAQLVSTDFLGADITNSILSEVDMRKVKNLTKEQILSATWGLFEMDGRNYISPPNLPKELLEYKEIKEWLEKPHFDELTKPDRGESR